MPLHSAVWRKTVVAHWQTPAMSNETWDGHRAVGATSGETQFRVRGNRMVDTNTGETSFRVRDDGRVVDVDSGETRFRVRDDGRVVDANTGRDSLAAQGLSPCGDCGPR
jgi:hypothetical protein